jgi:DNA-binding GntR family transcriptional regulator
MQDVEQAFWTTVRFEDTVIDICGNVALKRTLAPLRLRTLRFWHVLLLENIQSQNMSDVERLVGAICDREPRLAAELFRSLILRTLRRLENKDWSSAFAAPAKRTRKRALPKSD